MAAAEKTASGSGTQATLRRGLARTARRLRHGRPSLSIIVLAGGGDPSRLQATLNSVRDQPSPQLELLVVAYDGGRGPAQAAAGDDTRARFLSAPGLVEARLRGVRASRGGHVLVVSVGDLYPAGALADLVGVPGATETLLLSDGPDVPEPADLRTRPDLARTPYLGRVILPRAHALDLIDDSPDPDGMPIALAALAAGFTPTPYAAWRDDRVPKPRLFTHREDPLPQLSARVAADLASLGALAGPAQEQRALGAIVRLRPFLESAEAAEAATWDLLATHAATLVAAAGDQAEALDVRPRAFAFLAAVGRRDDVIELRSASEGGAGLRTQVVGDRVIAELPVALPPDVRVVGEHESSLVAQVRRLTLDDAIVHLEVFAGIRHVDQRTAPVVEARLVHGDRSLPLLVRTGSDPAVTRWMDDVEHDHDAGLLRLSIPAVQLSAGAWEIHLDWAAGDLRRAGLVSQVAGNGSAVRRALSIGPGLAARLRARHGRVVLQVSDEAPERPELAEPTVSRVEVIENQVRLTVAPDIDAVRLVGGGVTVPGRPGSPGFWTIPLEADPWGQGARPLPSGGYRLRLLRAGEPVAATVSESLMDRLPEDRRTEIHRVQIHSAGDGLVVRLDAPLTDDEFGARARERQRAAYARVVEPVDPHLVYFQSFTGQGVGDHPRALALELVRRRSDLDIRWLVSDYSAPVPAGTRPVLLRSQDWYDVLARAGRLVVNVELEGWFQRREGQQILQTFHGYPSKAMGLGLWEPRGLLPSEIRHLLERTSGTWNHLLTPSPEMDQYYRRDYAYDGPILALGSPRNDVLVSARAGEIRAQVRDRLGIEKGQRAVLYAPTWRDDLATNYRAAEAVHHLDVEQAAAALGEEWVLLLRGHRFHAPVGPRGSRIIDVTTYPEINDLILAADAAVLDYSSLRFDFALTGRPMVYLVPDLEDYTGRTRGFLWDYRETAPGPLVATTAEVVAHLRDVDRLSATWLPELEAFNARYNALQDGHAAERVVEAFFADLL